MENEASRRAHPRYSVANLPGFKARLDRASADEQILTLGAGGCGFVGFDRAWLKTDIKRVNSVFELRLNGKIGPISIQGTIVYIKPVTVGDRSVYYFGVRFFPQDAHRIKPVIHVLEELSKTGEVTLASA